MAAGREDNGNPAVIVLFLPPPLMPGANSRSHWRVRSKAARHDRYVAETLARVEMRKVAQWDPILGATLTVTWHGRGRLPDPDNIGGRTKAFIDGLTDAGLWHDDRVIRSITFQTKRVPAIKDCGVLIEVTRIK